MRKSFTIWDIYCRLLLGEKLFDNRGGSVNTQNQLRAAVNELVLEMCGLGPEMFQRRGSLWSEMLSGSERENFQIRFPNPTSHTVVVIGTLLDGKGLTRDVMRREVSVSVDYRTLSVSVTAWVYLDESYSPRDRIEIQRRSATRSLLEPGVADKISEDIGVYWGFASRLTEEQLKSNLV